MIILYPRTILQKRDKIIYEVRALKDLGLKPKATVFIHALRVMLSTGESTRKKKIEVMKSLGWSDEEIWHAF
jgi:mTERF domain-containing protein